MGLFDATAEPLNAVVVPGFHQAVGSTLRPLCAVAPKLPTPQDDGIQPAEGDDTSAPNATTAARMNRVVCVSNANVGYSKAAKDTQVLPSALEYQAIIEDSITPSEFSMTLRMIMEFESSFPEEGMVVWLKKHQQVINDEKLSELQLIETSFEDFVGGSWIPITTDVRYAEEAEAVVQAVITTDSGQTAGRVTTQGCVEDAKLGPVGERGRIILTYRCSKLYAYAEMGLNPNSCSGSRSLVPLGLQLPWSSFDNPGNKCRVTASVRGPPGATLLDPMSNILAYLDLQKSLAEANNAHCAIIPEPCLAMGDLPAWSFSRESLPPKPTMVLCWLSVPDADDTWEEVEGALPKATRAVLLKAMPEDEQLLRVALPGRQEGQLIRCRVDLEAPQRRPGSIRVHTDLTISDASGSTGSRATGGDTVRAAFSKHEERRVLKRLEAIPKLRAAGILVDEDVWRQHFVIFDSSVREEFGVDVKIGELDTETVTYLLKALANNDSSATSALQSAGKKALLDKWKNALSKLRGVRPGGATSFTAGAERARQSYIREIQSQFKSKPDVEMTTYVNFDTDGGNNCGPCYDAVRKMVEESDVVQGHVLGVGSWVDQDCASKVAKLLKGSVTLTLAFPEDAQADGFFRQDLSRWIKVLRTTPIGITVSAGATSWAARHGERNENGVDCIYASGEGLRFDQPDVTEPSHTKAVLRGLRAGESTTLYLLSRWNIEVLASKLVIDVGGVPAKVSVGAEQMHEVALGHHWLSMLGGTVAQKGAVNTSTLCKRLRERMEDDLSFAWNLPTKSGSTAAVGRAKTDKRPPVSKEQQPAEPKVPDIKVPVPTPSPLYRPPVPAGGAWGLFGGGGHVGPPMACAAQPVAAGYGGGFSFGASAAGGPAQPNLGATRVEAMQHSLSSAVSSAASINALAECDEAESAPIASASARRKCARPQAASGLSGNHPMWSAPPASPLPAASPLIGMGAPAAPSPFGFGGMAASAPPPPGPFAAKKKDVWRGRSGVNAGDPEEAVYNGPATPGSLLAATGHMRWGPQEAVCQSIGRGVKALKHLAKCAAEGGQAQRGQAMPVDEPEDPLVGELLNDRSGFVPPTGVGAGLGPLAVHAGFVCDATQQNPLCGVRFKATAAFDVDVTEGARRAGRLANSAGFKPIPTAEAAMRWALAAVLAWWPLVWKDRTDLFSTTPPALMALKVQDLSRAIILLPDELA